MSVPPPSRPATGAAERIIAAARQMVRSEDLEEVLSVAAAALGDALGGEAVLRVTTSQHDLYASASGIVPSSALAPSAHAALALDHPDGGVLIASGGEHAQCRVWVEARQLVGDDAVQRTVGELLLHSLAQSVDRIVMVDRFRQNEANLELAVESHRVVGQAMGILIERHRMTSEEAFGALRRASQDHNVKLREIARRVVETGSEPDEAV